MSIANKLFTQTAYYNTFCILFPHAIAVCSPYSTNQHGITGGVLCVFCIVYNANEIMVQSRFQWNFNTDTKLVI